MVKIDIGGTSGLAIDYSGIVYAWGSNTNGEVNYFYMYMYFT